jgi:hypothetical protein
LNEGKKGRGVFFHHGKHQKGFKAPVSGEGEEVLPDPVKPRRDGIVARIRCR